MRLVVNPEKMVIAEARRTYTYLGLFGYRVDAVVVNRIIPDEVVDPYFGKWKDIQAEHLQTVHESFEPVPILEARLFDREMVGVALLEEMGDEVYGERDATAVLYHDDPDPGAQARHRLRPVDAAAVRLARRRWTSIGAARSCSCASGSYKRNLILPQTLKRMVVREANFAGDHLEILFGRSPRPTARRVEVRAEIDGRDRGEGDPVHGARTSERPRKRRTTEPEAEVRCRRTSATSRSVRSGWRSRPCSR